MDRDYLYKFSIPRGGRSKVWTDDGRRRTDDGRQVITVAHPESSAQVSKKKSHFSLIAAKYA